MSNILVLFKFKIENKQKQLNLEAKKKASDFSQQITIKKIDMNFSNDSVEGNLSIQPTIESAPLMISATQNQTQQNTLKSEEKQDEKNEEKKYINWEQNELEKNSFVLGQKSSIYLAKSNLGLKNILSTFRSEQQNAQLSHSDWDSGNNQQQNNKSLIKQEQSQQYLHHNSQYEMPDILNGNNNEEQSFNSDNQSDSGNFNENIYNGDSVNASIEGSKKTGFHQTSGKEGSIFPKSENSFYETPYKNSDGKQFDEQYKRNFAHMLLEKTRGLQKHIAGQVVSREAEKIKVYANQVLIWMSIYRIVFSIEAEKAKRKLSESDLVNEIETRLIDYLNHNPNEKKYKFIKICNRTFRALKIKKCTGDYWLRQIFTKYEHKLNPRIDTAFLLKRLNKNGNQISGFDDDFPVQSNRGSQFLQLRCQNVEKSNRGWFPMDVKEKVIRKIDRSIESAISRIFQEKINQFCVSASQLKKWYVKFGRLQLFNPSTNFYQQEIISTTSKQLQPAHRIPNLINQSVINGPKRAEKQVLNFIKMNPSSTRSRVYSFACNVVQRLSVQQLLNQSNFSSWFNHILTSYCIIFNEYVQLKNNNPRSYEGHISGGTNFQIPITPQIRISSLDSLYSSQNSQMRTF